MAGSVFLFSGVTKAIDPVGASIKLTEYLQHFGMYLLLDFTMAMAWLQALFELALGVYLVVGKHRRASTLTLLVFMSVMTPLTLYLALTNPIEDCGCFGDVLVLSNWQTFGKNVVLLVMALWLWIYRRKQLKMQSIVLHTFYFYVVIIGGVLLLGQGTWALPYLDFRPFRPGVSVVPASDNQEENREEQYVIVYEKDGVQREFALDSIPDEGSGWEFVETRIQESARQTAQQAAHDQLVLFDQQGEEVTQQVLGDTGYVLLLLSPDLGKADEHDVDRIENLYEYAREQDYPFYCVTLNDQEKIGHWKFRTGSEYPFLYSDQQVIEMMIRSNPGFMLLHNGIILWKSHLSGIDVPQLTSAKLNEQTLGQIQPIDRKSRVFWLIVWLFVPLSLYLPLQIINFFIKKTNQNEKENCCR